MNTLLVCLVAVLLQSTVLHSLAWHDGGVSLIMLPLIIRVQSCRLREMLIIGACCGFIEDALCASGFAWTLATVAVMFGAYRSAEMVAMNSFWKFVGTVAAATLARDMIFWCIQYLGGSPLALFFHNLHTSLWNSLVTAAAAAILAPVWSRYSLQVRR